MSMQSGRNTARLLTGVALAVVTAGSFGIAAAAPGTPGVPDDPTVLWHESFSTGMSSGEVSTLGAYDGGKYTADPFWTNALAGNGLVIDGTSTDDDLSDAGYTGGAGVDGGWVNVRELATKLGQFNGTGTPSANHAVTAYTDASGPDDAIEFATVTPASLPANGRFLTVSANVAALNCVRASAKPRLFFYLVDGVDETRVNDTAADACAGASNDNAYASNLIGGRAALFTGNAVGLIIRNAEGNGGGNDHAYDDIRILDVTPKLDKVFVDQESSAEDPLAVGTPTDLVLTVTNTSELGNKTGWSFVDHLPSGLTVAGPASSTCDAAITAELGSAVVDVAEGSLAEGETSCDITVPVTSAKGGVFENSADNIESVGLNDPGATTVEFAAPPAPPGAPDTGVERTAMWPSIAGLSAGLLLVTWLAGRQVIGRRRG